MRRRNFMKNIKKPVSIFLAVLMLMMCAVPVANAGGYYDDEYNATQTLLSNRTGSLTEYAEDEYKINVASDSEIEISFSDTEGDYRVTILNSDGEVEDEYTDYGYSTNTFELSKGTYTIKIAENNGESLDYKFSVIRRYFKTIKTTRVTISRKKVKICRGNSITLSGKFYPSDSTQSGSWKSSNKKVATVDSYGYVYAKNLGKATITYKHGSKTAKCKITVNHETIQMGKGKSVSLKKMVKYVKGFKSAKWTSTNSGKVSVSKGKIKAKAHGQATITAKIKGTKYKFKIYSYDKKVIKQKAIKLLKSKALKPSSLKVHTTLYPEFNSTKLYVSWKNAYNERVNFYCYGYFNYGSYVLRIYLGSYIYVVYG